MRPKYLAEREEVDRVVRLGVWIDMKRGVVKVSGRNAEASAVAKRYGVKHATKLPDVLEGLRREGFTVARVRSLRRVVH